MVGVKVSRQFGLGLEVVRVRSKGIIRVRDK